MGPHRNDSVQELIWNIIRSGLLSEGDIGRFHDEFQQHGPAASAVPEPVTAFCSFLISAGALTSWQCEKLRNGQWKGFFQGEFVLLDGLGTIDGCFHSLGRHVKTGRYARLVSDPTKGDGIQFATRVVSWLGEAD